MGLAENCFSGFATLERHVQVSPWQKKESSFTERKRKLGGYCKHCVHGFSLAESMPVKKSLSFSSWALLSLQDLKASPAGLLTLLGSFCLLIFSKSNKEQCWLKAEFQPAKTHLLILLVYLWSFLIFIRARCILWGPSLCIVLNPKFCFRRLQETSAFRGFICLHFCFCALWVFCNQYVSWGERWPCYREPLPAIWSAGRLSSFTISLSSLFLQFWYWKLSFLSMLKIGKYLKSKNQL